MTAMTALKAASTASEAARPCACAMNSMTEAIAPGHASIGMAMGKIAIPSIS